MCVYVDCMRVCECAYSKWIVCACVCVCLLFLETLCAYSLLPDKAQVICVCVYVCGMRVCVCVYITNKLCLCLCLCL